MTTNPSHRLLPEWIRQDGIMLTWPHAHGDWQSMLKTVEPVFVEIARQISLRERVLIACADAPHCEHVAALLRSTGVDSGTVILTNAASNDTWARDHGPITVVEDGGPVLLDFRFDGWGGKYPAELDDRVPRTLYAAGAFADVPLRAIDFVLEGGGIETDGEDTLLTTASCMLYGKRNPGLTRAQVEDRLRGFFGIQRVLWLEHGYLAGDDTDGHIDTLARFCDPGTIAYVSCNDPADEHFEALRAMETELQGFRTSGGRPYRLVPLPMPAPIHDQHGRRLPATYANFLIINDAVLVPTYRDAADHLALQLLGGYFPGRRIVGIDCVPLIHQYGSLHCVTMQLPEGVLSRPPRHAGTAACGKLSAPDSGISSD